MLAQPLLPASNDSSAGELLRSLRGGGGTTVTARAVLVTEVVLLSVGYFLEDFKSLGLEQEALSYLMWGRAGFLELPKDSPGKAHSAFQVWCPANPV